MAPFYDASGEIRDHLELQTVTTVSFTAVALAPVTVVIILRLFSRFNTSLFYCTQRPTVEITHPETVVPALCSRGPYSGTWPHKDRRLLACGNNLLHQPCVQRDRPQRESPNTLGTAGGGPLFRFPISHAWGCLPRHRNCVWLCICRIR